MNYFAILFLSFCPLPALACGTPVCLVDPAGLTLPDMINFNDTQAGFGPGHKVDEVLVLRGAQFGERFSGQTLRSAGTYDEISGPAFAPLTLLTGAKGQNLSVVGFMGVSVLNGYGPAGFPRREAQGEGAIAILFDVDQSALSIDLRGGEAGSATVMFLRRDGAVLMQMPITPVGEFELGFERAQGVQDIASVVVTNTDPQGIAIDTIRFGNIPNLG